MSHLQRETLDLLSETWAGLPTQTSFLSKLRVISRLYRQVSKSKTTELRRLELDTNAKLGIATAKFYKDPYNITRQEEVNHLQDKIDGMETHRARGATIRTKIKWQKVGDKCTAEFFKSVRQKKSQAVISSLKDKHGRTFTNRVDFDSICHDFHEDLYKYREVSEEALKEVFEGFPVIFTDVMNVTLTQDITGKKLVSVLTAMAKGKAPGHDKIPMEFFKHLWHTIGRDYHQMIIGGIDAKTLYAGITKG